MYQQTQPPPYPGAYYGPPIPPQQPYQQRRRGCFCCLFSTLIKIFIGFCVALGITILILWLIFRPNKFVVAVERATLSNFNLTANPTSLSYNLSTNVSIRNPNREIGIYYDWLEADAFYSGYRFGWTALPTFYQGHKNTSMVFPLLSGRPTMEFDDNALGRFKSDNGTGYFTINMWLFARVRYKFGSLITRRYTARVRCELGLPLVTNGSSNVGFSRKECDVVDF